MKLSIVDNPTIISKTPRISCGLDYNRKEDVVGKQYMSFFIGTNRMCTIERWCTTGDVIKHSGSMSIN